MAELARRPSSTRGASIARSRRVFEARRGNTNALRHGLWAKVLDEADVASEMDLLRVSFPNLTIADERLILLLAQTRAGVARGYLALSEPEGVRNSTVTTFLAKSSALAERLERALFERDRLRASDAARSPGADPLARYRPVGDGSSS